MTTNALQSRQSLEKSFGGGQITGRDFIIPATDGYALAARLWTNSGTTEVGAPACALINAGAGISMRYYDRFAQFLASRGVPTLVYDYRGIGQSRPRSLRGFIASVEDWGGKDCVAALDCLASTFPDAKRIVVGHSVGGFVTGFATNSHRIDRMILIGAHTGYWRDYAPRPRPAMYLLWHALMPVVTRLVGYFPGRKLRLLEDLPKGVALEWANRRKPDFWWNRRTPDGHLDTRWKDEMLNRFLAVHAPTLAVRFTDDAFATEGATTRLLGLYRHCSVDQLTLGPGNAGGQRIGHFGFFRKRFSESLWPKIIEWLPK